MHGLLRGKHEQLWLNPMIRNLWTSWYIENLKVLIYLVLYYLGNIDAKHFWQELLLRILWIFGCCNILWNYLEVNDVFWMHWTCELLMWLCPCAVMLVITLSWQQQAKLETHTLYDTSKWILECVGEAAAYRAKRPHAKGVLCDTSFPAAH